MAKKPGIEKSTYSKPANLPGFLAEFMLPPLRGFSLRYGGGRQKISPRAKAGGRRTYGFQRAVFALDFVFREAQHPRLTQE